jgi:hypothetical protein
MFVSKRRAVVACAAMSLLATGSEAVCPDTSGVGETYDLHNLHFIALTGAKNNPPSYDYLQRTNPGNLCVKDDVSNIPELYKDCNKLFGKVYEEFSPDLDCDIVTGDEVLCATPYSQVVTNLCNKSGCPKSKTEFIDLFSLLASCGYLSTVGGAPALDSPEAATACLTQQGACQRESGNSLFKYITCRSQIKQLMFDGAKFIGLQSAMKKPDDCFLNKLLPQDRCDEEFGFQVSASYCAVQKSFFEQKVGETTMGTVLLAGSFGGVGALGAIYLRYRRPPAYPNYYSYNDDYIPGFQQSQGQSKFTSYYSDQMMPSYNGDFGQANAPQQSLYYGEPHEITGPAPPAMSGQSSGRMGRPTDSMIV